LDPDLTVSHKMPGDLDAPFADPTTYMASDNDYLLLPASGAHTTSHVSSLRAVWKTSWL